MDLAARVGDSAPTASGMLFDPDSPSAANSAPVAEHVSVASKAPPKSENPVKDARHSAAKLIPPSPPTRSDPRHLLSDQAGICVDEEYSKDEQMLNEFIKLHPMLRCG